MDYIDTFINLASNMETKKNEQQSKNTYRLDRIVQDPGDRVLYYLQNGPDRAFVLRCNLLGSVNGSNS